MSNDTGNWLCEYCGKKFPAEELALKHEKICDYKDVITEKWIEIEIGISAYASGLMNSRQFFKDWAKELNWEFKEGKKTKGDGDRPCYPLSISPKGGKISPAEFEEEADKLIAMTEQLASGFAEINQSGEKIYNNTYGFSKLMEVGKKEAVEMTMNRYEVMSLKYPLYLRLNLEQANLELAKTIFLNTAEEEINSLDAFKIKLFEHIFNRDEKAGKRRIHERLKNWFDIKINNF